MIHYKYLKIFKNLSIYYMISENHLINFIITISCMLLFLIFYFIKICTPFADNKCYINGLITLPKERFFIPFSKPDLYTKILFFFDLDIPYIWLIMGLIVSYIIIKYKPIDRKEKE